MKSFKKFQQIHEAITARHCDMKVFAFSLITNKCVTEYDDDEEGLKGLKAGLKT
jgi:purine nucleoside phosphorylase